MSPYICRGVKTCVCHIPVQSLSALKSHRVLEPSLVLTADEGPGWVCANDRGAVKALGPLMAVLRAVRAPLITAVAHTAQCMIMAC